MVRQSSALKTVKTQVYKAEEAYDKKFATINNITTGITEIQHNQNITQINIDHK